MRTVALGDEVAALKACELLSLARVAFARRAEGGRFELFEARSGETIELASIGARLDVSSVYANPLGTPAG